jgi:hypothetical protein
LIPADEAERYKFSDIRKKRCDQVGYRFSRYCSSGFTGKYVLVGGRLFSCTVMATQLLSEDDISKLIPSADAS